MKMKVLPRNATLYTRRRESSAPSVQKTLKTHIILLVYTAKDLHIYEITLTLTF
jgi:hypothetical protein